jgi:hypothetical protein
MAVSGAQSGHPADTPFLLWGNWAMLDALWHDVHFAGTDRDCSGTQLDVENSLQDEKKSSVSSCLCQTNSSFTFTTITS